MCYICGTLNGYAFLKLKCVKVVCLISLLYFYNHHKIIMMIIIINLSFRRWYFGKVSRKDAEMLLQSHDPGTFLVRDSESSHKPGVYVISRR